MEPDSVTKKPYLWGSTRLPFSMCQIPDVVRVGDEDGDGGGAGGGGGDGLVWIGCGW